MKMTIAQTREATTPPVEAVERKGIGHPDSLADLIAEEFSRLYSAECLDRWDMVLNHWVDKVNLVGSAARVGYGAYEILKPVSVHLFGKVSEGIGRERIDAHRLLRQAARTVLDGALGQTEIARHIRFNIENSVGSAPDHGRGFYHPGSVAEVRDASRRETVANDTVLCSAYATVGDLAHLARDLEALVTDPRVGLTAAMPAAGTDVKVVAIRAGDALEVTACVPGHADRLRSRAEYDEMVAMARALLEEAVWREAGLRGLRPRLVVNSKDSATSAYLCPFGTALGKGDCGVVGRGNRINGAINVLRPSTAEAPAGKNPLHHVGKLYTIAAQLIANECIARFGAVTSEVLLATDNGRPLTDPRLASVQIGGAAVGDSDIAGLVLDVLEAVPTMWRSFLDLDVCAHFRRGGFRRPADLAAPLPAPASASATPAPAVLAALA
jgi:S-adenosylmethionine synthetase